MRDRLTAGTLRKLAGLGAAAMLLAAAVGATAKPILPPPEGQPVPRPMMASWLAEGDPVRKYIAAEQPAAGK